MPPPKFLLALLLPHFANPRGLRGRLVARIMNRGNRRMNEHSVASLELGPEDRVVDVGFGGGATLAKLASLVPRGRVTGIDPSPEMVERARRQHADLVARGQLQLEVGTIERLPLEDASADALMTVNTVYFWTDHELAVAEMARVLAPGGRLALTFLPKKRMEAMGPMFPTHIFTHRDPDDVMDWLRKGGFRDVRRHDESGRGRGAWCSVAARR